MDALDREMTAQEEDPEAQESVDQDKKDELNSYQIMKAAAEHCLIHIFHHIGNFPPIYGPSMINSQVLEPNFEDHAEYTYHYFANKGKSILTVIDRPNCKPNSLSNRCMDHH